jgi:hypothetical protein
MPRARNGLADHSGNGRLETTSEEPPVPAYLVRLIQNRDIVGFFAADDFDDLVIRRIASRRHHVDQPCDTCPGGRRRP